jgi:hypothetical protein
MTQTTLKHPFRDRLPSAIDNDSMLSTGIISTLSLSLAIAAATPTDLQQESWSSPTTNDIRVPVTLGVMSRCPDALQCETLFDNVIPRVAEKINLSLAYVAKYVLAHPFANMAGLVGVNPSRSQQVQCIRSRIRRHLHARTRRMCRKCATTVRCKAHVRAHVNALENMVGIRHVPKLSREKQHWKPGGSVAVRQSRRIRLGG